MHSKVAQGDRANSQPLCANTPMRVKAGENAWHGARAVCGNIFVAYLAIVAVQGHERGIGHKEDAPAHQDADDLRIVLVRAEESHLVKDRSAAFDCDSDKSDPKSNDERWREDLKTTGNRGCGDQVSLNGGENMGHGLLNPKPANRQWDSEHTRAQERENERSRHTKNKIANEKQKTKQNKKKRMIEEVVNDNEKMTQARGRSERAMLLPGWRSLWL
jgi:hypothetical protein